MGSMSAETSYKDSVLALLSFKSSVPSKVQSRGHQATVEIKRTTSRVGSGRVVLSLPGEGFVMKTSRAVETSVVVGPI
ncbi:hypothetical protein SASPL_157573 [Salvia splendens]|uniref:Uncharacterized protein n=1 Tax=Salvia splendens TaxID=180675 RepID=A0A8X8YU17_SALSN|nr:hypothetical protein SASPL_157573 [Salvia splendens]